MHAPCSCSQTMNLSFRTVIYGNRIEIRQVPVWECEACGSYEVEALVKDSLLVLLKALNNDAGISVSFTEYDELSAILFEVYQENKYKELDPNWFNTELNRRCKERINVLLDVYSYAKTSGDKLWMDDLMKRLSQLAFITSQTF